MLFFWLLVTHSWRLLALTNAKERVWSSWIVGDSRQTCGDKAHELFQNSTPPCQARAPLTPGEHLIGSLTANWHSHADSEDRPHHLSFFFFHSHPSSGLCVLIWVWKSSSQVASQFVCNNEDTHVSAARVVGPLIRFFSTWAAWPKPNQFMPDQHLTFIPTQ